MTRKRSVLPLAMEIEHRQDEILQQLDELNDRVEKALAELGVRVEPNPPRIFAPTVSARAA